MQESKFTSREWSKGGLRFGRGCAAAAAAASPAVSVAAAVNLPPCLICDSTPLARSAAFHVGVSLSVQSERAHKINIIGTKANSSAARCNASGRGRHPLSFMPICENGLS